MNELDKEYIRNGYWFLCVSVLMVLLLFHFGSSQLVQYPYSSIDDLYSKDQIFPKLEVNDKDTLEAEFKVLNPLLQEIDVEKSSLNVLEIDFDKVCGDVIDYTFEYKTNCTSTYDEPISWKEVCSCSEYDKNDCECIEIGDEYKKVTKTYECWKETDKLPSGVYDYKIKVNPKISECGDSWGYKIDWIPTLKTTNTLTGEVSELIKDEWAWFNSTWGYRNLMNITHNNTINLTNFQTLIELNTTNFNYSLANTTGQDIRFALENGTMLNHCLIDYNTTGTSKVWVNIPSLISNTNSSIYMYYGNPSATYNKTEWCKNTFDFYDGFDEAEIDWDTWSAINGDDKKDRASLINDSFLKIQGSSSWLGMSSVLSEFQFGYNYSFESRTKMSQSGANAEFIGVINGTTRSVRQSSLGYSGANSYVQKGSWGPTSTFTGSQYIPKDTRDLNWNEWYITRISSSYTQFSDLGNLSNPQNITTNLPDLDTSAQISGSTATGADLYVDWIRVRKYAPIDPTVSYFGETETNTNTFIMYAKDYVNSSSLTDFSAIVSLNQSQDYTPYIENAVACYLIDGDATDSCGSNNGTVTGATLTTDRFGDADSAYSFNGSNYINISDNSIYTGDYLTVSMWIKPTAPQTARAFISKYDNSLEKSWQAWYHSGVIYFRTVTSTGTSTLSSNISVDVDDWGHIVLVYNGTHNLLYINSTLVGSSTQTNSLIDDNNNLLIGANHNNGVAGSFFIGDIDDILIYNTSLSATEIEAIYNSSKSLHYYTTSSGIINTSISNTSQANITYSSDGYISRLYTAVDTDSAHTGYLWQAEATFDAYDVDSNSITPFNVTIDGTTKQDNETWYLSAGTYNATFEKADWRNMTMEIIVSAGSTLVYNFTGVYQAEATFDAYDILSNSVTPFNVTINGTTKEDDETWYLLAGAYNATFSRVAWYNQTIEINVVASSNLTYNFTGLYQSELHLNLTDIINGSAIEGTYFIDNTYGDDVIYQNTTQVSTGSKTYVVLRNISLENASNIYYIEGYYSTDSAHKYITYEVILRNGSHYNSSEYDVYVTGYANYTLPVIGFPVANILIWGHRVGAGTNLFSNNITVYGWNTSTNDTLYLTAGNHSIFLAQTPYYPLNLTLEITARTNSTEDIEMYTNEIWLYGTRSRVLENFTCTYQGITLYNNPYQISNLNDSTANMSCTKVGFKPANVSPSTDTPANESFYLDETTTTSFPVYVYDEVTLANITNATLYVFGEEPYVFNWTSTNRTIAINGSGVTGMLFAKTGYNNEEYYVDIAEVYGQIDIYMLPTNDSINASFNLQDGVNVPIDGGLIDIYKFYPELVSYVRVSTYRTDDNGNATIYWESDKFYKVNTRQEFSDTMYEAIDFPFTPSSTRYNVKYGLSESEQNSALTFLNMNYDLSYTVNGLNQTIFSLTFNDLTGVVVSARLNVIERGVTRDITLCNNSLTASAGEILCVVNESEYVNTLSAWGTFETSTTFSPKSTARVDVPKDTGYLDLGAGGLFITFILTATGLIAGLFISVPVGLMFLVATLILAMATGLFWMQISAIVSLAILILLIIFKR